MAQARRLRSVCCISRWPIPGESSSMKKYIIGLFLFLACTVPLSAQFTTTVTDSLYGPTGAPAAGTITIVNPLAFVSADNYNIAKGTIAQIPIGPGGTFTVNLVPNVGSTPSLTYYQVSYFISGTLTQERWIVPHSATAVNLIAVRSGPVPLPIPYVNFAQMYPPPGCLSNQIVEWMGLPTGWACVAATGTGTVTNVTTSSLSPLFTAS